MIELYGWMSVSETYGDEDALSEAKLQEIMNKVECILEEAEYKIALEYMNGIPYIRTSFSSNHRSPEVEDILKTYRRIAETATGSYGVIYLRDDEDKDYYNVFRKFIYKKGSCTVRIDEDFSPCNPQIEE